MQAKEIVILLADDDTEDLDILKQILLDENPALVIKCVFDGQQAISSLQASSEDELPSLIVLDYQMPIYTAIETLELLQDNMRYATIPKVVWSASDQLEHRRSSLDTGAVFYFTKPDSYDGLVDMARQMLKIMLRYRQPG